MGNRSYMLIFRLTIAAVLMTGLSMAAGQVTAMPPHPDIQGKIQSGEVALPFAKTRISGADSGLDAPAIINTPAFAGSFKALCIMVDFSDNPGVTSSAEFDTLIFAAQTGTVRDYYDEVSYGQIDLVTVNLPSSMNWKRAPQTYAYYVDNDYGTGSPYPHNTQKLCEDLVDLVDAQVDFSEYDNDGDGYVDALLITHAGPGAEYTGNTTDIWSHKWSISPRNRDGVLIYNYAIMPEFWNASGDMTIGVYCHELGHVFGLPDLYDTDGSSQGVGNWSLMATGSWNGGMGRTPAHPDAWCKSKVGWLTPTVVSANQTGESIP
ncbi:MAG: M6 family metalloprotease domain-containing protein, partial [candidate division Zixibacteria bacterium]|nr:M6 family metalloprotease domain-containing protein [candidate division Zixibacteria bacterium]